GADAHQRRVAEPGGPVPTLSRGGGRLCLSPLSGTGALMKLRLRNRTLSLEGGRPLLMGIVNTSRDSVADPVRLRTVEEQHAAALEMRADGAAIIDVGGDSGRTDRAPRAVEEELGNVVPLVERLVGDGITVSVDTFKPPVAEAAVAAGATLINDISRLPELAALGRPILLAVSRKYFIGALTDRPPDDRLAGTLAAIGAGVDAGATILRVHDVSHVARFLRVRGALLGLDDEIPDYRDE